MTDLSTLGGSWSAAYGVNDLDVAVGVSGTVDNITWHAFLRMSGTMRDLGTLPGGSSSTAYAINNSSQVVGVADVPGSWGHAFLWEQDTWRDLGTFGGIYSVAQDINNPALIVGSANTQAEAEHAFFYPGTTIVDMGTLPDGTYSRASAVNASSQVVGVGDIATGDSRAFFWEAGVFTDLGTLGGSRSWALDINSAGDIVGGAATTEEWIHPFVCIGGAMKDLNDLLFAPSPWPLRDAVGINDAGQIIVQPLLPSMAPAGAMPPEHALLLTPAHPADANGDWRVNVDDLGILASNYDTIGGAVWETGDFTGDGNVNVDDLGVLASNYDWVGPGGVSVPEPATLSLLGACGLALFRRKRA